MKTAIFAYKGETLPKNTTLPDREMLFDEVRERGIDPVVSLQGERSFDSTGVETHHLIDGHTLASYRHTALDRTGVIVNRLDRIFKVMPDEWTGADLPIINQNALRSLVFRKQRVADEVFTPLGIGMPNRLIESVSDVQEFVDEFGIHDLITKPNSGTHSKGVESRTAQELLALPIEALLEKPTIIQPKYDFTIPFSDEIRPYDATSAEAFKGWGESTAVKEFRIYTFKDPESVTTFPVARAMHEGTDHWLFVDPESIPQKLHDQSVAAAEAAARITGSRAIFAALDFGYGARADEAPDYHAVELNGRMPYLIGSDKHPGVARALRRLFADQIKHTADSSIPSVKQ